MRRHRWASQAALSGAVRRASQVLHAPPAHQLLTLSQLARGSGRLPGLASAHAPLPAGAGLQFQLPPLVTWRTRLPQLLPVIESYLSTLRKSDDDDTAQPGCPRPHVPGPLFLALRLFPDATLAALENRPETESSVEPKGSVAAGVLNASAGRGRVPIHRVPLSAFMHTDQQPWGAGVDPSQAFKDALQGLEYLGSHLSSRLPLVLIVPTRLLVSQSFCERLLVCAARSGVSTVALELPSTATLLESETRAERNAFGRVGAVSQRWHRLAPLCTGWDDLTRLTTFRALRSVGRHQLMPLHVLVPWLAAQGILSSPAVELGLVVDTTPPRTHYARRRAGLEHPGFLLDPSAQAALALPESPASSLVRRRTGEAEEQHHYLGTPLDKGLTRSWRAQTADGKSSGDDRTALRDAASASHARPSSAWSRTAQAAEAALRKHRMPAAPARGAQETEQPVEGAGGLTLGPPPDDVKALILQSIRAATPTSAGPETTLGGCDVPQLAGGDEAKGTRDTPDAGRAFLATLSAAAARGNGPDADRGGALSLADELAFLQRRARDDGDEGRARWDHPAHEPHRTADPDKLVAALPVTDDFGVGYWRCISCLSQRVLSAACHMSMPSLNSAQLNAWRLSAEQGGCPSEVHLARAVPFVPVLLPLLTPPALEAQRVVQEGPRRRSPGRPAEEHEGGARQSLLGPVDTALAELLDEAEPGEGTLPRSVHRALAFQRPTLHDDRHMVPDESRSHLAVVEEDEAFVIRAPRRPNGSRLRPLEYAPPAFAASFAVPLTPREGGNLSRNAAQALNEKEKHFEEHVLAPALRDTARAVRRFTGHSPVPRSPSVAARHSHDGTTPPSCLVSLSVAAPGLDEPHLLASWRALFP